MTEGVTAAALPPSEFDVRGGARPEDPVAAVTVDAIKTQIHALAIAIEALKILEGPTEAIECARRGVREVFAFIEAHSATVVSKAEAALHGHTREYLR